MSTKSETVCDGCGKTCESWIRADWIQIEFNNAAAPSHQSHEWLHACTVVCSVTVLRKMADKKEASLPRLA